MLNYTITPKDGGQIPVSERIPLAATRTNFGGVRKWLTCLKCRRRVGVLYGGHYFRCRQCHGLTYSSQYEPAYQTAIDKADKLRRRVGGGKAFDGDDFPAKPKWMRWATYNRLLERYDDLNNRWAAGAMRAFEIGR